jgi:hypothetical protein
MTEGYVCLNRQTTRDELEGCLIKNLKWLGLFIPEGTP